MILSFQPIATLAVELWEDPADQAIAVAIARAESGGDTDARSNTGDTGLWQINDVHGYSVESLKDPWFNAQAAKAVYDRQGWDAWTVYRNGRYRNQLTEATLAVAAVNATGGGSGLTRTLTGGASGLASGAAGVVDAAGNVAGAVAGLADLTPDGLAELALTVGAALVILAVGGVLVIVALNGLAAPAVDKVKADVGSAAAALT